MADGKKQLGTLELNKGNVIQVIDEVNKKLGELGKGVDLNLTNILNAKVNEQLNNLKQQIDAVNKASTGRTSQQNQSIREASVLLKEQQDLQTKLVRSKSEGEKAVIQAQIRDKEAEIAAKKYTEAILRQGEARKSVQRAQETFDRATAKAADDKVKAEAAAYDKYLSEQKRYHDAFGKAQQEQEQKALSSATRLRSEILDIQKRLNAGAGVTESATLQKQLEAKSEAYAKYSESVRKAVESSEAIVRKQEELDQAVAKYRDEEAQQKYNETYAFVERGVTMAGRVLISALREQWSAAIDYATQYYDTLNEIRVVTGKNEAEATQMGDNFRKLAKEMKVTSTELASAAVTFYRQGLNDTQVNERLNWVTKYAKVANIDFNTAAELITATTNAMSADIQGDIERVVDVFLYLGDAAATSGEEIGVAMQKASASAVEFGVSFEWLGAYIATVAEQTRQAPQVIGTAFNSMMSRLHQIRSTGYNQEDATKINDVAKALSQVNIALMDSDGNWRDMSTIFTDIAGKWDTMTDKQKSYLSTTLAGTRQQNVFYALMNDMSKGLEGGSRAWQLYTGALEAAGTATEKFSVWQESVAASQSNFQASMENIYASLQPNLIKGFYDVMAGIADVVANVTKSMGGLNFIIPAVIAGIMGVASVVIKLTTAAQGASGAFGILGSVLNKHPVIAIATALVSLVSAITLFTGTSDALVGVFKGQSQAERYSEASQRYEASIKSQQDFQKEQQALNDIFGAMDPELQLTNSQLATYSNLIEKAAGISPTAALAMDDLKQGAINLGGALKIANEEYDKYIQNLRSKAAEEAFSSLMTMVNSEDITKAQNASPRGLADIPYTPLSAYESMNGIGGFTTYLVELGTHGGYSLEEYLKNMFQQNISDRVEPDREQVAAAVEMYFRGIEATAALAVQDQANQVAQYVLANVDIDLSSGQRGALTEKIIDYLAGEDGELSVEDVDAGRIHSITVDLIAFANEAAKEISAIDIPDDGSGGGKTLSDILVEDVIGDSNKVSDALKQLEDVNSLISKMDEGKGLDLSDVLGLAKAHPEIQMYINDIDGLRQKLDEQAETDTSNLYDLFRSWVVNDEDMMKISPFADEMTEQITTLQDLLNLLEASGIDDGSTLYNEITDWLAGLADAAVAQTKDNALSDFEKLLEDYEKQGKAQEALNTLMDSGADNSAKVSAWQTMLDIFDNLDPATMTIEDVTEETENLRSSVLSLAGDFGALGQAIIASMSGASGAVESVSTAGFLKDLRENISKYSQKSADNRAFGTAEDNTYLGAIGYIANEISGANNVVDAWYRSLQKLDDQGLLEGMIDSFGDFTNLVEDSSLGVEDIIAKLLELREAAQALDFGELADSLRESREANIASTNDYQQQINELTNALETGGISAAKEVYDGFLDSIQSGIQERFPNLIMALADANQAAKDYADGIGDADEAEAKAQQTAKGLERELKNITRNNASKYFTNTAKAIEGLNKGTTKVSDAYADFNKEAELAVDAQAEFRTATANMAKGTEVASGDVKNLAKFLGDLDPDWLLDNWEQVGPMLTQALAEGQEAFDRLNEAAFINITGTSSADFSAITNGLIAVRSDAEATIAALQATGQWDLVEKDLPAEMPVFDVIGGKTTQIGTLRATGKQTVLKMKSGNPFASKAASGGGSSGKSSGGGGGGGGGKEKSGPSEVEIMLDRMEQVQKLQNHTRSLYSAQAGYYAQTGELQGVILYYQKETEAIQEQNKTLEDNVAELSSWIQKKKAEVDSLDKSSEEYETAANELKELQERHQDYSLELINNRTEVDKLTKAIKEQQDTIRQMEIDLRNTILQAIEDREELNERMLQGVISVENEILDMIQRRYEKERDLILENSQRQIDLLQQERDLLDEQLQLRKEQAEEEEKAAKLAELEAKYARIAADPTRKKEMLTIEKQINELRDEMAWDLAEKEVRAQQESIDEQITSIEDYMEYIEEYYNDMFEHPQKLIAEMKEIIKGTDEEIMDWLKKNSEDYADKTEATQRDMVNNWQSMLDDMRGAITTYWDEVESIIAQGDDAIIAFLKENSADYRAAGKLQAEAYVDEWMKQLEDLRLAYKQVSDTVKADSYSIIEKTNAVSESGGGGGGGGKTETSAKAPVLGMVKGATSLVSSDSTLRNVTTSATLSPISTPAQKKNPVMVTLTEFATGGIADFSGPAWLDGSKSLPERVLTPQQNELFESLVASLEAMTRLHVSSMPSLGGSFGDGNNEPFSVGDIIVNVEKMDSDADYEEMASKVFDQIMERLNRGSVIGGIRLTR